MLRWDELDTPELLNCFFKSTDKCFMNLLIIYNWRSIKDDAGLCPPPHSKKVTGSNFDPEPCCVLLTCSVLVFWTYESE